MALSDIDWYTFLISIVFIVLFLGIAHYIAPIFQPLIQPFQDTDDLSLRSYKALAPQLISIISLLLLAMDVLGLIYAFSYTPALTPCVAHIVYRVIIILYSAHVTDSGSPDHHLNAWTGLLISLGDWALGAWGLNVMGDKHFTIASVYWSFWGLILFSGSVTLLIVGIRGCFIASYLVPLPRGGTHRV
eukprot:gnl/Dysnectes_brevis/3626_a4619_507.p1 GENE.gnl/Dysnectes_brevis/3626_a4619_507~~gnl/Dysnectes_brevis/3626_a4619_507.p1  ORF type:complete len:188 (-),score=28.44 gnl/Dysnectes_brevis/3626_a4619_507:687-1250(-)